MTATAKLYGDNVVTLAVHYYGIHSKIKQSIMRETGIRHMREKLRGLRKYGLVSYTFSQYREAGDLVFSASLKWEGKNGTVRTIKEHYFDYHAPQRRYIVQKIANKSRYNFTRANPVRPVDA